MRSTRLDLADQPVLVVGSNTFELDVITQILAGLGASQLRRGETIEAAQAIVARGDANFLMIDHRNDDSTAFDLTRQVRRLRTAAREMPVMMLTAYSHPRIVSAARDSGIDYVLTKPLTARVLFQRMSWVAHCSKDFIDSPNYVGPDRRVRAFGPPPGSSGRRASDLTPEVGAATEPNMTQDDLDALFKPQRASQM